jgi:hypothetical protein
VKEFLSRQGVPFQTRLLTDPANRREAAAYGTGPSPLTIIGGKPHWGFDRAALTLALDRTGQARRTEAAAQAAPALAFAPKAPLAEAVAIASFLGDSITYLDRRTGAYLGGTLEASSVPVPGHPIVIEACVPHGTAAAAGYESGTVTFLGLRDGLYLRGTADDSTLATGKMPLYAMGHPVEPLLYISNSESNNIRVFDPRHGAHADGGKPRDCPLPGQPGIMALNAGHDLLYVRLRAGAVVMLRARTLRPARGTLEASTFKTGRGRGLALSCDRRVLHVPEALEGRDGLALYDALTGQPLLGSRERSMLPTAPTPFAVTAHPAQPIVYLSCFGPRVVEYRDANTGAYLRGSPQASSVPVGSGARAMVVDPRTNVLYVSCYDEGAVYMFDAVTGKPRPGPDGSHIVPVGRGPRGMCLMG